MTYHEICTMWGPQTIAKLVHITPISLLFMVLATIVILVGGFNPYEKYESQLG